ncbi:hypothetical protein Dimus_036254 [Dionaea muscipula]
MVRRAAASAGAPRRAPEGGRRASKLPTPGSTPASIDEQPVERWRTVDGWRAPSSREASSGSDDERILPELRPAAHQHLFLTGSFSELWRSQRHADLSPSLAASCLCMPMPSKQRAAPHQAASTEQRSGEPRSSEHRAVERRATEQRAAGTPPACASSSSAAASHSLAASDGATSGRPSAGAPRRAPEGGQRASSFLHRATTPASGGERH